MDDRLLGRVRRVRQMREAALAAQRRQAETALASRRSRLDEACERLAAARTDRAEAAASAPAGAVAACELEDHLQLSGELVRAEAALGDHASRCRAGVRTAERQAQTAGMVYRNAQRRRCKIDHLNVELLARRLREAERAEEGQRDELVTGRFGLRDCE